MAVDTSAKLDAWTSKLLDLTKRNSLLNYRYTKRGALRIETPGIYDLWERFVVNEQEIVFSDEEDSSGGARCGIKVRTHQTPDNMQQTLRAIKSKARTMIEEQGTNSLHLSFGFLRWREAERSDNYWNAPLLLVPVALKQESIVKPFKLSLHEDEIVLNPTLVTMLHNNFGIDLPEWAEESPPEEYLELLRERLPLARTGWEVLPEVALGMLSFSKINMYRDLMEHKEAILSHPLIRTLCGDKEAASRVSEGLAEIGGYDHDSDAPNNVFQVVDADSSQQDAILCAKRGLSFVLQGPPGTGKSQTITNIIAECLAMGKKVLFVSEKMAALEVVRRRIDEVGLGDFCLTLHSHKENKRYVIEQLDQTLRLSERKAPLGDEASAALSQLLEDRTRLNNYVNAIHEDIAPLGKTIYEVNGILSRLSERQDVIFALDRVDKMTKKDLSNLENLIGSVARAVKTTSGNYADNPWYGANITSLTHELRHDIEAKLEVLVPLVESLGQARTDAVRTCHGLEISHTVNGIKDLLEVLRIIPKSPAVPSFWVNDADLGQLNDDVHLCLKIAQLRQSVGLDYEDGVFSLDKDALYRRFKQEYGSSFKVFKKQYKADKKLILSFRKDYAKKISDASVISLLEQLREADMLQTEASQRGIVDHASLNARFGQLYRGESTDWKVVISAVGFIDRLKAASRPYPGLLEYAGRIIDSEEQKQAMSEVVTDLRHKQQGAERELSWLAELFDDVDLFSIPLDALSSKLRRCRENLSALEEWIDLSIARKECVEAGLGDYLSKVEGSRIPKEHLVDVFRKRFYRLWLDRAVLKHPVVERFRRKAQEELIREFVEHDKLQFAIARQRVRANLVNALPDQQAFTSGADEVGILRREIAKKRRVKRIRRLFREMPHLITRLKPCLMMSPLSVSVFLESEKFTFDTVIFDEASQVRTEDAVGAIFRGKQVVIAGDSKQLPPTNFFSAGSADDSEYDEEDDAADDSGAFESLLDEASSLPERQLLWHYRSRHEHLIAFSNAKIYNNSLITFPSNIDKAPGFGVDYTYVPQGYYDRGERKGNSFEAQRVAELVFEHLRKYPERSLGVIAFGEVQAIAIDAELRKKRMENQDYEWFFSEENQNPFFVKNLENVQGDERDTIIFSIGYAKDIHGVMRMNFGPLSGAGGQRRLNVAITRAKYNVKLVGSIQPTDIAVEKIKSEGPKLLRSYIDFAQRGVRALESEVKDDGVIEHDSPFEKSVYGFLDGEGYYVSAQVGCSGYRIDLAIRHPDISGVYVLGIECDGAAYHSARTARERDRIRQDVLEKNGWRIYRIWSTDWIKDPLTERNLLIDAVEKALHDFSQEFAARELEAEGSVAAG